MPFVHVKLARHQVTPEQKKDLISGLTNLIVELMGRDRHLTVIVVDEIDGENWAIGGKAVSQAPLETGTVSFINIKVSKGTTNAEEMSSMIRAAKKLTTRILGNCAEANYVIIDELSPDGWGFDGMSMTVRNKAG